MNPFVTASSVAATCAGAVAYAAVHPRAQIFGPTVCRTNSARKLAITFDDGPNPAMTPQLLDLLERYDARATFFVIGKYAEECAALVRETARRGHVVANHTLTHPNLFWRTPAAIQDEMRQTQDAIAAATGATAKWFRPPYGFRNPWVVKTAAQLGMRTATWSLIPGDWTPQPAEKLIGRLEPIARRAQKNIASASAAGDVLCLHDGGHRALNADRTHTLKALGHWLPRWREAGLEFVTIEEAVSAPAT
jgi:peptidoglycan-N-acetylglucosamine deacetylase